MVRPGIRTVASALVATLLLLPGAAAIPAQSKADAKALPGKDVDDWQKIAQWRAVTPDELAMTSEPLAPGAPAIFLYTELERSDVHNREFSYRQIKILTEEGRNLANISINYNKQADTLRIEARVIQPDGTIVPFSGEIYDRPLVSNRQVAVHARSFTLPDVRVGSIIEMRYWRTSDRASHTRWMLNQSLFARHARYSLQLYKQLNARWTFSRALPPGVAQPKLGADDVVRMEVRNMQAFVSEDYMPPADDLVLSVDFSYGFSEAVVEKDPAIYWRRFGMQRWAQIEYFLGNPKYVSKRLEKIVARDDSPEQKVRKIYEHVRQMGNIDIPASMDKKAEKKCSQENGHVWDVGADGCGNSVELQLYFLALVRAAGIAAAPVEAVSRQERFFAPEIQDVSRFDSFLIAVTIGGREVLLNPAAPFLPFGALSWFETNVPAYRLTQGGGEWFTTPAPAPADAVTRRKAKLTLSEDGVLEGTVVVRHTGHEATARIMGQFVADEQSRLDALKEDLRNAIAVPAEITVVRQPDWRARDAVFEIEYRVKVQQWAVTSGNRMIVGMGLFGGEQLGKFVTPEREHPIYFVFPFIVEDELEITLPAGFKVQDAPARQASPDAALKYVTSVESREGAISIRRSLTHNLLLANQGQYARVKSFYELVRSGDQEQVVLVH